MILGLVKKEECSCKGAVYHIPCFCITLKNLTITLLLGRIMTWRFPAFSALLIELRASLRTEVRTILTTTAADFVFEVCLGWRYRSKVPKTTANGEERFSTAQKARVEVSIKADDG